MHCPVCETENEVLALYCESCGYRLTGEVAYCVQCHRETFLTAEGRCPGCGNYPEGFELREAGDNAAWSYTSLATMAGRCVGCGCQTEADRIFCEECETEIKAALDYNFTDQRRMAARSEWEVSRASAATPVSGPLVTARPRLKFSRSALALLAVIPVVIAAFWLRAGSEDNAQPAVTSMGAEAPMLSPTASEATPAFTPAPVPPVPAVTPEKKKTDQPATRVAEKSVTSVPLKKSVRPAPTPNRNRISKPSAATNSTSVRPMTPARPEAAPTVHSRPRRVNPDPPEAAPRKGQVSQSSKRKNEKPLQAGVRWPLRFIKGVGKKAAALVR